MKIWVVRFSVITLFFFYCFFSEFIDLAVTRFFYTDNEFPPNKFANFLRSNFHYPAQTFMFTSIALFFLSYVFKQISKYRRAMILVVICVLLTPHLSRYYVKKIWDRPRPTTVKEFGGKYDYRPFYVVSSFQKKIQGNSFPSGHCVRSFCFVILCVIGYTYKNYLLLYIGIFLTILFGGLQAYASIALGRHFLSDTLGSLLHVLIITIICHYILLYIENKLPRLNFSKDFS